MFGSALLVLPLLSLASASAVNHRAPEAKQEHDLGCSDASRTLPGTWYQPLDHFAHSLFRRQTTNATNATSPAGFPPVGSPTWTAAYPSDTPDSTKMPQAWKDALNAAVQAGKIPNIPLGHQTSSGSNPTYGSLDPNGPEVCSGTYQCRIPGQIWDAPAGTLGLSFDDGPLPPSDRLYAFLKQNNLHATHFFIGENILQYWKEFLLAFETNQDDIAVHTYTHPYMTTLSNEDVVAQLGWTMQIIYDSTGGRLAGYWRPPYGDTDTRVTAIAKEVFGLTTVVWNQDTEDWSIGEAHGTTPAAIQKNFQTWLAGPKSPGLIILEHELMNSTVQAFMDGFPLMTQNNWSIVSVAQLNNSNAYQNSKNSTNPVLSAVLTAGGGNRAGLPTAPPTSSVLSSTSSAAQVSALTSASSTQSLSGAQRNAAREVRSPMQAMFAVIAGLCISLFVRL